MKRILLAYSGGLDTSIAIPWLAEHHDAEVVTLTLDLGQGRELDDARERALAIGAARAHVLDGREEFARDFILPALQAGALYEGRYPLATALGRPLIARDLVRVAKIEGATAIAHGGTNEDNDLVRMEVLVRALDESIEVMTLDHLWDFSQAQKIAYARNLGIPVSSSVDSPYTVDTNLWGRSIAWGGLEDPWQEPPEAIYELTRSPAEGPSEAAYVQIDFEKGVPRRINGVEMSLVELISSLETIAGAHGVGRIDMVENRVTGTKSREVYEAPAAVALHLAHDELQTFVIPRDLERLTTDLGMKYADLVYNGLWFAPTREAIAALVAKVQERVTGTIRLKLFKGDCRVVGRQSAFAQPEPASSLLALD